MSFEVEPGRQSVGHLIKSSRAVGLSLRASGLQSADNGSYGVSMEYIS